MNEIQSAAYAVILDTSFKVGDKIFYADTGPMDTGTVMEVKGTSVRIDWDYCGDPGKDSNNPGWRWQDCCASKFKGQHMSDCEGDWFSVSQIAKVGNGTAE